MTTDMQIRGAVPEWDLQDRLKKARRFAGLDQRELAERIGVSRATVANYEAYDKIQLARPVILKMWAFATGVSYSWLVQEQDQQCAARESNPQPAVSAKALVRRKLRPMHRSPRRNELLMAS